MGVLKMKLGEIITMIEVPDIYIEINNDFYYYENFRTKFFASVFNDNKLTENEILNMTVKTITTVNNNISITLE